MPDTLPTASAPAPGIHSTAFERIPVAILVRSPKNPRNPIRRDDPKTVELAGSITALGLIEPIVVRRIDGYGLEILAGERRWVAHQVAGLADIECKVLVCDDRTALQITVVENLQRVDLSPLEEARGVRSLLDAGYTPAEVCAELGKSASWVALRAQLTALSKAWTDGLAKGKFAWAGCAHLEQIARLPAELQDELAKDYDNRYGDPSANELAKQIAERYLHTLKSAPWKLEDAELVPSEGACAACPKRSDQQQLLFPDQVKSSARCLDAVCWRAKMAAHTQRQAAALALEHDKVVVLTSDRPTAPDMAGVKLDPKAVKLEDCYSIERVAKTTPGAMPAVDSTTGQRVWITPARHCYHDAVRKVLGAPRSERSRGGRPGGGASVDNAEVNAKRRLAKRFAWRFKAIGEAAEGVKRPAVDLLLRLVCALIIDRGEVTSGETWESVASTKRSAADDLDHLWESVRELLPSDLERVLSTDLPDLEAVQAMERLTGLQPAQQGERALAAIPEPRPKGKRLVEVFAGDKPARMRRPAKAKAASAPKPAKAKGKPAKGAQA